MSKHKNHKQASKANKAKSKVKSILDQVLPNEDTGKEAFDNAPITKDTKPKAADAKPTEIRDIKPNGEVKVHLEDSKSKQVLTDTDKAIIDKAKTAQAEYRQAKIKAQEALKTAKQAMEALNGSDAIKAMTTELEAKIAEQEANTQAARTIFEGEVAKLQDLQTEFKQLTGLDKKSKASNGKSHNGNGNGRFEIKVQSEEDDLRLLVTHKESRDLWEYRLFATNGTVSQENWLKLRHQFIAHFESKEDNLTLRSYLSGLKNRINAVKTIA